LQQFGPLPLAVLKPTFEVADHEAEVMNPTLGRTSSADMNSLSLKYLYQLYLKRPFVAERDPESAVALPAGYCARVVVVQDKPRSPMVGNLPLLNGTIDILNNIPDLPDIGESKKKPDLIRYNVPRRTKSSSLNPACLQTLEQLRDHLQFGKQGGRGPPGP
jgi:hypothetical protein